MARSNKKNKIEIEDIFQDEVKIHSETEALENDFFKSENESEQDHVDGENLSNSQKRKLKKLELNFPSFPLNIDFGGARKASAFKDYVLSLVANKFKYNNWPFNYQTPEELEIYLWTYGSVAYFEWKDSHAFVPVTFNNFNNSSSFFHKKIISEITKKEDLVFTIQGGFSNLESDIKKLIKTDSLPFIFANLNQTAPAIIQNELFLDLRDTFNAMTSNKINKNRKLVFGLERGKELTSMLRKFATVRNFDSYIFVKQQSNFDSSVKKMFSGNNSNFTEGVADLFSTLSTEAQQMETNILKLNGIFGSNSSAKTSAQETDSQVFSNDEQVVSLNNSLLKARRKWIKNLNKNLESKLEVDFHSSIRNKIQEVNKSILESANIPIEGEKR